jgi:hypothetical protein
MSGNNSAFPWNPSTKVTPLVANQLNAGEWVQVRVSYRNPSPSPVVYTPGRFLIHVIVKPCTDDTVHHFEQPTTFGGSPTAENLRSAYHIDPGQTFQVPWRSELYIVAGGDSAPELIVDVVVRRGYPPRVPMEQMMAQLSELYGEELAMTYISQNRTPTVFAPPVVGIPQLVTATWIDIPENTVIDFPNGAVKMEAVNQTGVPASPIQLSVAAFGQVKRIDLASGALRSIGPWAEGGACSDGTPGQWQSAVPLGSMTMYSSFGN